MTSHFKINFLTWNIFPTLALINKLYRKPCYTSRYIPNADFLLKFFVPHKTNTFLSVFLRKKFHNGQYCCLSRPSIGKFHRSRPIRGCTRFFELNKKIDFARCIRPADPGDQMAYDARKRAFFGSVLRGLAAERFETLPAETLTAGNTSQTWAQISDAFVNRFSDNRDQYRERIEIENIQRQPNELITSYINWVNTAVEKGWPNPFTNEQTTKKWSFLCAD